MSLQYAAKHLASKGRGPDTELVHMTKGEINSLQSLARANGGTLTINPDTGLPEAGFLSSILPIVAGAALGPAGFGLSAMQAGLAAGAIGTLATGSLQKGLMAGLGAYGGAGLMGSVVGAGSGAAVSPTVGPGAMGEVAGAVPVQAAPMTSGSAGMDQFIGGNGMTSAPVASITPPTSTASYDLGIDANPKDMLLQRQEVQSPAYASFGDKAKAGLGAIANNPSQFMTRDNLTYGAAAMAPMMMQTPKQQEYEGGGDNPYQYDYSANPTGARPSTGSSESKYFDPRYTRKMADGGIADLFDRARSAANGSNTQYVYVPVRYVAPAPRSTVRDPFSGMTGDSANAYRYLMGMEPLVGSISSAAVPANAPAATGASGQFIPAPAGTTASGLPAAAASGNYNYDSGSGGSGFTQNNVPSDDALSGFLALNDNFSGVDVGGGYGSAGETAPGGSDLGSDLGNSGSDGYGGGDTGGYGGDSSGDSGGYGWAKGGISSLAPGYAKGGYNLGDYSDGGRLLRGPGDGVSDDIPATIGGKRPARLADGEFVVPARIVSELGNGSTEAGARKLYAMMDRIQQGRRKSVGKDKVAVNSRADKHLPA